MTERRLTTHTWSPPGSQRSAVDESLWMVGMALTVDLDCPPWRVCEYVGGEGDLRGGEVLFQPLARG